jgi:hypothetical protein
MTPAPKSSPAISVINLEAGRPSVQQALSQLERALADVKRQGRTLLKLIHGYGSSGMGGDIRIAVQKRLHELKCDGKLRAVIFGEEWARSNAEAWELLSSEPTLKNDADLGRRNRGITIVQL